MSNNKFMKLSRMCAVIGSPSRHQETDIVKLEVEAAALARELFPPMAKPLAWELTDAWRAGQYRITQTHGGIWWVTHPDACSFKGDLDTAKAACEAHHQARLKIIEKVIK